MYLVADMSLNFFMISIPGTVVNKSLP